MMARAPLSILCAAIVFSWACPARAAEVTPEPAPAVKAPGAAVWAGFAVSPAGRVFSEQSAEDVRARVFARRECERATGATCRAIAVRKSWKVSAVLCGGGGGFVAGVPTGSALPLARQKAFLAGVRVPCRQVFSR